MNGRRCRRRIARVIGMRSHRLRRERDQKRSED
jgi:hypothetical protein